MKPVETNSLSEFFVAVPMFTIIDLLTLTLMFLVVSNDLLWGLLLYLLWVVYVLVTNKFRTPFLYAERRFFVRKK